MIRETISQLEARLQNAGTLSESSRQELLTLLNTLRAEVAELSKTDAEQAQSIEAFVLTSAHEATRSQPQPQLLQYSLGGLSASVEGFEKSHPALVQIVNRICGILSNLGI